MTDKARMSMMRDQTSAGNLAFRRTHLGLPHDAPWVVRVPLRSRSFLFVTVTITALLGVVVAFVPQWLLWFDEPASAWTRSATGDGSIARVATLFGSPNISLVIGIVGVAVLWRWCRASAATLAALLASAFIADIGLKLVVDRPRPPNPLVNTALASFPRGHVIHAVVLFGIIPMLLWVVTHRRSLLRLGFVVFTVGVLAVAISRVALGAHWPSDVIVSLFIGISLLLAAEKLLTSSWAVDQCNDAGLHSAPQP